MTAIRSAKPTPWKNLSIGKVQAKQHKAIYKRLILRRTPARLNDLAEAFKTDPSYTSAPIYFYQQTATPFTKEDLAKTTTATNLQAILRQIVVNVSAK